MFTKILIANRGEIAIRVIKTCREMGIRTVAVYSQADQYAYHVREADEAYAIGPAPATESYLDIAKIIAVARQSGSEAIHPGYGFLAENPRLAEACVSAGIVFIGPSAEAMRLMGSKIAAKGIAVQVGAPIVPGYSGEQQSDEILHSEALRVGFPLLIKASAGGGGKGMRVVSGEEAFLEQLAGARREALSAFGDDTVFLERLIEQPRHIEIQILGDHHGNIIHLGERECSIQRRHQKILEESPSVALTPALRSAMGESAVRIARAAGYTNAGTIEFILDQEKNYYFLEMNTRLQVEHPVTELVTGLDLVRQQLLISSGEPLSKSQEQISPRGQAIEVRIYAEDPAQNFLPSTGTISTFIIPEGPGVRVDSGIQDGDEITQYYDPMIAKLIVYGEDREAVCARLQQALEQCVLSGVTTNIPLLHSISQHPAYQAGNTHTAFLTEHHLLDTQTGRLPDDVLIASAIADQHREKEQSAQRIPANTGEYESPWSALGAWRMIGEARTASYSYDGQSYRVSLQEERGEQNTWRVQIEGQDRDKITVQRGPRGLLILRRGEVQSRVYVQSNAENITVTHAGQSYILQRRQPPEVARSAHASSGGQVQKALKAPMAGTIIKVNVSEGQEVEAHQSLVILSAMKMEHAITAPYAGKVKIIAYQEGQVAQGGAIVVEME